MRVVCVGAGYFSQFHLDGWQRVKGAELVGICDIDSQKAKATGLPVFESADRMLSQTNADVLDVILPPTAQADAIRAGLNANLRAIICQKPFCQSPDEAVEMAILAEEANVPLIVHENFRFQPWYRTIRNAIQEGRIGTPLQATFRLRPGDGQGAEAYLARQPYFQKMERFLVHETAVHWIDTFRFLFGDPTAVYADLRQINPAISGEDAGYLIFDHPNAVRSIFDGNRLLDHAADNTRCTMGEGLIEGTKGTLELKGDGSVHRRTFGETASETLMPADTSNTFGGDCARRLQQHVVDALNGAGELENRAQNYLKVVQIEAALYRSAAKGQKISLHQDAQPN